MIIALDKWSYLGSFVFKCSQRALNFWLTNLLTLSFPDEGYSRNANSTKDKQIKNTQQQKRELTQVLLKCKQYLFLIRHMPCYSQPGHLIVLSMIEEGKNLRKLGFFFCEIPSIFFHSKRMLHYFGFYMKYPPLIQLSKMKDFLWSAGFFIFFS